MSHPHETRLAYLKHAAEGQHPRGKSTGVCTRCGKEFTPHRVDQRICSPDCPGKPDIVMACANKDCSLYTPAITRTVNGTTLKPGEFIVKGGSRGKGNQQYCSEKCRDHVARIRQGQRFRRYSGLTREQYIAEGEARQWKCDICGKIPLPDSRRALTDELPYLIVEHDHETDERRGLTCSDCNLGLGMFHDNPEILQAAIMYLKRWHAILREGAYHRT